MSRKASNPKPPQIVIVIEGGNVQDVSVAGNSKAEVYIIDHDNIDAGDDFDGLPWQNCKATRKYVKDCIEEAKERSAKVQMENRKAGE